MRLKLISPPGPVRKRAFKPRKTDEQKAIDKERREQQAKDRMMRFLQWYSSPDVHAHHPPASSLQSRPSNPKLKTTTTNQANPDSRDGDSNDENDDEPEDEAYEHGRHDYQDDEDPPMDDFDKGFTEEAEPHITDTEEDDEEDAIENLDSIENDRNDIMAELMDGGPRIGSKPDDLSVREEDIRETSESMQQDPTTTNPTTPAPDKEREFYKDSVNGRYGFPDYKRLFDLITSFKPAPSTTEEPIILSDIETLFHEEEEDEACEEFVAAEHLPNDFTIKMSLLCKIMGITRQHYTALSTVLNSVTGPGDKIPLTLRGLHSWHKFLPKSQVLVKRVRFGPLLSLQFIANHPRFRSMLLLMEQRKARKRRRRRPPHLSTTPPIFCIIPTQFPSSHLS